MNSEITKKEPKQPEQLSVVLDRLLEASDTMPDSLLPGAGALRVVPLLLLNGTQGLETCDSLDQVNLRSTRRHRSVERHLRAARARDGSSIRRSGETGALGQLGARVPP